MAAAGEGVGGGDPSSSAAYAEAAPLASPSTGDHGGSSSSSANASSSSSNASASASASSTFDSYEPPFPAVEKSRTAAFDAARPALDEARAKAAKAAKAAGAAPGAARSREEGETEEGVRWSRESGIEQGENGYRCTWVVHIGEEANGARWEERWWDKVRLFCGRVTAAGGGCFAQLAYPLRPSPSHSTPLLCFCCLISSP